MTQPASVEPYSSKSCELRKCAMIASLVSRRAGADEIISFDTRSTSYLAFTAAGRSSIMM